MKNAPGKNIERACFAKNHDAIIAVDEVGMGCLAGPVVVGAVLIRPAFFDEAHRELTGVRDSKLLSSLQRERLAGLIRQCPDIISAVVAVSPRDVDRYNVLRASHRGMRSAIMRLITQYAPRNPIVLVDGSRCIPDIGILQQAIIGGDRRVFSIACASILAKVYRDALMVRAARRYPEYGFELHKGYGTKMHYARLLKHGPSVLHRKSFRLTPLPKNSSV